MIEMTNVKKVISELKELGYQAKEMTKIRDGKTVTGVSIVRNGPSPAVFADERDVFFTSTEDIVLTLMHALENTPDIPDDIGKFDYWKEHCYLSFEKTPEDAPKDFDPVSRPCPIPGYVCCIRVGVADFGSFLIKKPMLLDKTLQEIEELWKLAEKRTFSEVKITKGESETTYEATSDTVRVFAALYNPKPLADICKRESVDRIAVVPCSDFAMLLIPVQNELDIMKAQFFWQTQCPEAVGDGVYVYDPDKNRFSVVAI